MKRRECTLSPEPAASVDSFSSLALSLPGKMATLLVEIEQIEARIRVLAEQGLIRAVPDWRSNRRGKGEYLTIVFQPDSTGKRPRKYIGRDPAKVQAALAALDRAEEYDRLVDKLYNLMAGSVAASCYLSDALHSLTCHRR